MLRHLHSDLPASHQSLCGAPQAEDWSLNLYMNNRSFPFTRHRKTNSRIVLMAVLPMQTRLYRANVSKQVTGFCTNRLCVLGSERQTCALGASVLWIEEKSLCG